MGLTGVFCKQCGASRPATLAEGFERPPCPHCGDTTLLFLQSMSAVSASTASASATITTPPVRPGWAGRWEQMHRDLSRVKAPTPAPGGGDALRHAAQELMQFYVLASHLADDLEAAGTITHTRMDEIVAQDPDLALLRDLCNLAKHVRLVRRPWSGALPAWGVLRAGTSDRVSGSLQRSPSSMAVSSAKASRWPIRRWKLGHVY
jgi:hypothetical protein